MRLELSELFVCPRCRPVQGLVVLVERLESDRRVRSGHLGCPACEARFPIRDGTVRFGEGTPPPSGSPDPELATEAAALSGLREGEGVVLVDAGLAPLAARISELTGGAEVLALSEDGSGEGVSRAAGVDPADLPLFAGRLDAAVLLGGRGAVVGEWARVLREGGRLVALRPSAEVREEVAGAPVEVMAEAERALVAVRTGEQAR